MANRSGTVIRRGCVSWELGFALGTTLVCRALMKMMAATRMISIVTRKAITTGLIDESPTRFSGVGLLAVGFCTLMDGLDAEGAASVRRARVIGCEMLVANYSPRPAR